jgi:hypothetical protein
MTAFRFPALAAIAARDATRRSADRLRPPRLADDRRAAIERGIAWLCRTHDVTGRQGSSKGFSLLHGWMPAYPETTGYVLGTLLEHGEATGRGDLIERAHQMADWEAEVQGPDGGIREGAMGGNERSIVFNTGMVLHGWVDLLERGHETYAAAGERAVGFLVDNLRDDGTWDPGAEYQGRAHTYNSRVAWAMLRWARQTGDERARVAARRQLDWTVGRQRDNGWFDDCIFKEGTHPSTHGIAYTLRGLLESHAIEDEPRYLEAATRTSEVLIRKLEVMEQIPANWDAEWKPTASHWCLTGTAQLGGVWLRLFELTGDARFLNAGLKAVDQAAAKQERGPWREVVGALAGSYPAWGRYAPLQYPNWAAKFLTDSLVLAERLDPGRPR